MIPKVQKFYIIFKKFRLMKKKESYSIKQQQLPDIFYIKSDRMNKEKW